MAPKNPGTSPGDCCRLCIFFTPPKSAPDQGQVPASAQPMFTRGECFRFPTFVPRRPQDRCGEFEQRKD